MVNGPELGSVSTGNDDLVLKPGQDLVLVDGEGRQRLRLDASSGMITVRTGNSEIIFMLEGDGANLWLGGHGKDGDLLLLPSSANTLEDDLATVHLDANQASIRLGNETLAGRLLARGESHRVELDGSIGRVRTTGSCDLQTADGKLRIRLSANGTMTAGGDGENGRLQLRNETNATRISLRAANANATIGGEGASGEVFLLDADGTQTIHLNGTSGNIGLGSNDHAGGVFVKDNDGKNTIVLNGATGNVGVGAVGTGGGVFVKDNDGQDTIVLNGATGNVGVGASGQSGDIFVKNASGSNTIHLNGQAGDILMSNGDCAEDFDKVAGCLSEPGTVMIIDEDGHVRPSDVAYDYRVAGVVSGAGCYRAAIVLDRRPSEHQRVALALMGKVYCKVDARSAPIRSGDLLTTSDTPGHAMKAIDSGRTAGAVLGKALRPLKNGLDLIPVLVALQ